MPTSVQSESKKEMFYLMTQSVSSNKLEPICVRHWFTEDHLLDHTSVGRVQLSTMLHNVHLHALWDQTSIDQNRYLAVNITVCAYDTGDWSQVM